MDQYIPVYGLKVKEHTEEPPEVFYKKKEFIKILQNSQENTCARVSFLINRPATLLKKDTLAHEFPCEFCEIL